MYDRIVTTQDFMVTFELFKVFGNVGTKKLLSSEQREFFFTIELHGWAIPQLVEMRTNTELQVLFCNIDNAQFYDLTNSLRTASFVDNWFQQLLSKSIESIERFFNIYKIEPICLRIVDWRTY